MMRSLQCQGLALCSCLLAATAASNTAGSNTGSNTAGSVSWEVHMNATCHGGTALQSVKRLGTVQQCEQACGLHGRCLSAMYANSAHWCLLYNSTSYAHPTPGHGDYDCICRGPCARQPGPPRPPRPPASHQFAFAGALGSGMVLAAAPKRAMIWGFCDPGAPVTVRFGGGTLETTIGPDQAQGQNLTWRVLLPATMAGFEPRTVTATQGNVTLTLTDVLFGEVWMCGGQSNMEYPLVVDGNVSCWDRGNLDCKANPDAKMCKFGCVENASAEVAAMAQYDGGIRLFKAGNAGANHHAPLPDTRPAVWWAKPSATGGDFSAMCWFFGRDVFHALGERVPVGLVQSDVSGTPDQHWSSPDALAECKGHGDPWDLPDNFTDSVLWNSQIVPLLRTVVTGAIWMQGEANSGADGRQYRCTFAAMIKDWRRKWHTYTDNATDPTFPFGWSQLNSDGTMNNYTVAAVNLNPKQGQPQYGEFDEFRPGFAGIRAAETATLGAVPNTFQAVILDTPLPNGGVHSPYKQVPSARLARGALALQYGMPELHAVDPVIAGVALAAGQQLVVSVSGVGPMGLEATVGADGFEVLANCTAGYPHCLSCLCWHPCPIAGVAGSTLTVGGVPLAPLAVRFLYHDSPCGGNDPSYIKPYLCPVYAKVAPLGPLSGEDHMLPLAPFFQKLAR